MAVPVSIVDDHDGLRVGAQKHLTKGRRDDHRRD
jgi:hypothetical protein